MLDFQHYQAAFTAHLRHPEQQAKPSGTNTKRMGIYREIVFNNFLASASACFPVLQSVLGKRAFRKLIRHCFSAHHFGSPLFKDISKAVVDFLQTLDLAALNLPPYTTQLAHYEWVELFVSQLATTLEPAPIQTMAIDKERFADCILQLPAAHVLANYDYPVQQISNKHRNMPASPTYLLVYRKPDFKIEFIQLNAVTFQLLQQIKTEQAKATKHLSQLAQTILSNLPVQSVHEFGLNALLELYSQQAVVIQNDNQV
jgi:uncharacterized protein